MSLFRRRASDSKASLDTPDTDATEATASSGRANRPNGPWDASEVDLTVGRLDLGSLLLSPTPGLELRIEVDQETDTIAGIQLIVGDSAAQVQAFAAPRSGGLWDEIRDEIAASITAAGGTAEEAQGEFGAELRVKLPQVSPEGRTVFAPARFLGIDGPRWFVRAVISGRAALDPDGPDGVLDALRGVVVVRGGSPMAPRELLPLQLPAAPDQATPDQAALDGAAPGQGAPDQAAPDGAAPQRRQPDLNPFERGPEITEVR